MQKSVVFTCGVCGQLVRVEVGKGEDPVCPCCRSPVSPPPSSRPPPDEPIALPPKPTTLQEEWEKAGVVFSTDDDGKPYPLHGAGDIRCPECQRLVPKVSKVCTGCGFNFRTGAKPTKTFTPYTGRWEIGMPLWRRRKLFLIAQAVVVPLGLFGAWLEGSPWAFLVPWVLFTCLLAFVLGTYERIELTRTARGQVRLTRTWRVCFFERPALTVRPRDYEGVATGLVNETGCWEWLIFFILLGFGIIPGLIWLYLAILKGEKFSVALTRDHGYPALPLCRSADHQQMKAIAAALREVAELPYGG